RQERLDVADAVEIAADGRFAPALLVIGKLVAHAAIGDRAGNGFGGQNAREDRIVRTLDARHVDETGRAADQRAAGEDQLRYGLPAALGNGAGAIGDARAALEGRRDRRMGLEALELLEGREVGIAVV